MLKQEIVFLFVVLSLCKFTESYAQSYAQVKNRTCLTPFEEESQCIPLESCTPLINFLNGVPKPFPDDISELFKQFLCQLNGDSAEQSLVCCPSGAVSLDEKGHILGPTPPPEVIANDDKVKYLPIDCGQIGLGNKVVGGTDAGINEFPWMALLLYNQGGKLTNQCGGSIINEKYILTAAHCVVNTPLPLAGVRVGEYSLLSEKDCDKDSPGKCLPPVQHLIIESKIIHPEYSSSSFVNDIALLRVTKMDMEAVNVKPVCLPVDENTINQEYIAGIVTGWGNLDENGTQVVDKLQKLEVEKQDITICADVYKQYPIVNVTTNSYKRLCLGGEEAQDSCKGDSGGPFQVPAFINDDSRYVQRGIVSIGNFRCGTKAFPAIYTNVDYYMKWIIDSIYP